MMFANTSTFSNTLAESYRDEVCLAAIQCKDAPTHAVQGTVYFSTIVNSEKFEWALVPLESRDVKLYASPPGVTHAVCAENRDVLCAGEGSYKGGKLTINNRSGHYKPSCDSLEPAKKYWIAAGFLPENIIVKKHSHELVHELVYDGFFG
ncbi:hypothetical protein [Endozoicomonas sp. SCSIO W0465]|uniref:hypothetical protein n=1 Tax=Endozoicomonas sp. SCSIO W0465 TaxID=2918516 RepID=UPI002074CE06|nr:hypothetical protein [Endozoicomonas sp. SCSIO W0465]USE36035.1 hypothetical protein MJO57_28950 [Endozoicomonas sp. SCSIO W0465]